MQTGFSETLIGWKLAKPLISLYGTESKERGYGLRIWTREKAASEQKRRLIFDSLNLKDQTAK
jgi:hypothetical protein